MILRSRRRALTLIEVTIVCAVIGLVMSLAVPAVQRARESANRITCTERCHQIGLALQQYHDQNGAFPPGCSYRGGADPFQHMGWAARLLPFVGRQAMWDKTVAAYRRAPFFMVCPPHQANVVVPDFLCPSDGRTQLGTPGDNGRIGVAFSFFQGVSGTDQYARDGVLFLDSRVRISDISDGASRTIMVGERPPSHDGLMGWWYAGWGQAQDGSLDVIQGIREKIVHVLVKDCSPLDNTFQPGRRNNPCDVLHFWSVHPGGSHFLMCDGSAHFLTYTADAILPALATRAGGEAVGGP